MKVSGLRSFVGALIALIGWACAASGELDAELVKRAEAGDAGAQYDLGVTYSNAAGVERDYSEAVWLVVTSGNFLIAAETRLKTGIEQW